MRASGFRVLGFRALEFEVFVLVKGLFRFGGLRFRVLGYKAMRLILAFVCDLCCVRAWSQMRAQCRFGGRDRAGADGGLGFIPGSAGC